MEKRYYSSVNYNLTKMLTHLQKVVLNNDGHIACRKGYGSYNKEYEIHNRSVIEAIHNCEFEIERIKELGHSENEKVNKLRQHRLESLEHQIEQLKQDQPKPFATRFLHSITFVYDGKLYYFQMDENPFFPFNYMKKDISEDGKVTATYLEEFSKEGWMFDCLFDKETAEADLREIACILFNKLIEAKDTDVYYEDDYKICPTCGGRMRYKRTKTLEYEEVTY